MEPRERFLEVGDEALRVASDFVMELEDFLGERLPIHGFKFSGSLVIKLNVHICQTFWQITRSYTKFIAIVHIKWHDLCSIHPNTAIFGLWMLTETSCKMALMDGKQVCAAGASWIAVVNEPCDHDLGRVFPLAEIQCLENGPTPPTVTLNALLVGASIAASGVQRATPREIALMVLRSFFEQIVPRKGDEAFCVHFLERIYRFSILYPQSQYKHQGISSSYENYTIKWLQESKLTDFFPSSSWIGSLSGTERTCSSST